MSYENQQGFTGTNNPNLSSVQDIGAQIANRQGGIQYEPKPGGSLSGGAIPERNMPNTSSLPGSQEPGYEHVEHISAPRDQTSGGVPGLTSHGTGGISNLHGSGGPDLQSSGIATGASKPAGPTGYGLGSSGPAFESSSQNQFSSNATSSQTGGLTGSNYGSTLDEGNNAGKASIGGGGINKDTFGMGTGTGTGTSSQSAPGTASGTTSQSAQGVGQSGIVQQAVDTVQPYVAQAQEVAAPYVAQAQEAAAPYVQKAQETAGPYVAQAQEAAAPYIAKAQELGTAAVEQARPVVAQTGQIVAEKATQAYNAAAAELDARGINKDTTQQKLAEVGQTMKDYGAVGQQRAGEYLQQAVEQAKSIGHDNENKSLVATIFGTVFLVWLAFGFSIGAVFALGVAGSIAAILSRYTRGHGTSTGSTSSQTGTSSRVPGTTSNLATPGVETHYPRPSHPDNSLNSSK